MRRTDEVRIQGYRLESSGQFPPSFYEKSKAENDVDKIPATCYWTNRKQLEYIPQFANMRNQIEMLGSLRHENIQEYRETIIDDDKLCLFVEYEERPYFSLFRDGVDEDKLAYYFRQLMSAVAYLHRVGIVHRDVNPQSVFVNLTGDLKLGNFFFAVRVDPATGTAPGGYAKLNYQAPELFCDDPVCDAKADVWACGVMLLGTLMWQNVFRGKKEEVEAQVLKKKLIYPESCSKPLVAVLDRMLERDPKKRATAEEVLAMDWLTNVTWSPPAPVMPRPNARSV